MRDFTIETYEKFIRTFQENGYVFMSFAEWFAQKLYGKCIILRHDIDKKPENALVFADLEHKLGIKATYYFLKNNDVFNPAIIKQISGLGHEIGYHYRDLVEAKGDKSKAIKLFEKNLNIFREIVSISTISMDGCPWSVYDNRDLWTEYDYSDFGITGEPYFDFLSKENAGKVLYFTDTARMWNGNKYNVRDKAMNMNEGQTEKIHSTANFMNWIKTSENNKTIMITIHPQRWTDNRLLWLCELIIQRAKNMIKYLLIKIRKSSD
jgi:hypothetical protein